jgi:hypothetical protein
MQSIMKVSSIGPFTGPQETDIDREDEVELANLTQGGESPVAQMEASGDPSEDGGTKEGVIRLVEYLARRQAQKNREKKTGSTKLNKALSAYEKVVSTDIEPRGKKINRWR